MSGKHAWCRGARFARTTLADRCGGILGTPRSILFSPDGSTWTTVEYSADVAEFEGMIEVAGNTIYIFDARMAELLVGTILPD